jgi:hypothetical protein
MLPPMPPTAVTRRALLQLPLAAGAVAGLAACTDGEAPTPDPQAEADTAAVLAALETEQRMHDMATRAQNDEVALVLRRHVELLSASLTPAVPATPRTSAGATDVPAKQARLGPVLSEAADSYLAALPSVSGSVARMLASVASSDRALAWSLGWVRP